MKSENGGAGHVIGAMLERFRQKEPPVPEENEYIGENGLFSAPSAGLRSSAESICWDSLQSFPASVSVRRNGWRKRKSARRLRSFSEGYSG